MVAYEFGLNVQDEDKATVLRKLNLFFIHVSQSKQRPLLVVDEAQNLKLEALEELRLLTNLQFEGRPLLQIFMVGQEELRDKIQDTRLEQLRQRITAACHLDPLTLEQTTAYIIHRLRVVGWNGKPEITAPTFQVVQEISRGVPRRINQFCSRLLLHGALEEKYQIGPDDARLVVEELTDEHLSPMASEHDFLAGAATPGITPAGSEPQVADESLLKTAEELLRQQEHTNRGPRPVQPVAARTVSPGNRERRKPAESRPEIPTLAEPQIVEQGAVHSAAKTRAKANPVDRDAARQSRWPIVAYTMVIVLVMAIPFLALPGEYLEKWLPEGIRTLLPALSLTESASVPQARPGDSTVDSGTNHGAPVTEPPEPVLNISNGEPPAAAPVPVVAERTPLDPDLDTGPQAAIARTQELQPVQPAVVEKHRETETPTGEAPSTDDPVTTSDRSEASAPLSSLVREISFGFDSTEISFQDRRVLDEVARYMQGSNRWMAHVVGYTDRVGSRKYNQRLSQLRANVVAAYLTRQGVPADRLRIEGRGSFEHLRHGNGDAPAPRTERLVRILLKPR